MSAVVTQARNQGYTTTLFGRRRYLPELKSDNFRVRQMGERMALNAPVQGTAADIIKKAMIELDARLTAEGLGTTLLLQIHDELILESPADEVEVAEKLVVGDDGRGRHARRAARGRCGHRPRPGQREGLKRPSTANPLAVVDQPAYTHRACGPSVCRVPFGGNHSHMTSEPRKRARERSR